MHRGRRIFVSLVAFALLSPAPALAYHSTELLFSEYVEGSSFNKAVEIFNPTSGSLDLSGYSIQLYFNGSASVGNTIALPAVSLAPNDVFVVAHSSADAQVLAVADLTTTSLNFNGDDAVALVNGGTNVDVIGQIGVDPGAAWGTEPTTTANHTLRRFVCVGDPNGADVFDPSAEWLGFPSDTFDDLGFQASTICHDLPGATGWALAGLGGLLLVGATIALRRRAEPVAA